ncbi:YtxH domain-containing protein [Paenibacillus sp.]|uniref:YtxH domain-containing protein n=1 Tax=Paenibacillus sp. TaxID=58172 RepID=UPI00281B861D|nr:YtxH domain-containing protein [Paenibacillus sp.]MDR0270592.1 YtxH domain-containing protein [Paenibacillus sp.]
MKEKNKSLLWGALIGSLVGSVTALLFAPKSGKELRQDIAEGARSIGEQSVNLIGKVKDTAGNVIQDIRGWRNSEGDEEDVELARVSSFEDGREQDSIFSEDLEQDAGEL